jgi:pimeloyl-ACP methyl ester carboxylesterase
VADYSITAHANDLEALVTALRLSAFVLVGMSMGGVNAIRFAGRNGTKLAGLVIVDVGPEIQQAGATRIRQFSSSTAELDSVEDFVAQAQAFNPRRDATLLQRSLLHNLRQTQNGKWTWKYDPRARVHVGDAAESAARRAALWDDVDRIDCPTLVVRGGASEVFADSDADKLVGRLWLGEKAIVENAGHTVQGDNPVGFVRVLRSFLKAHDL